MQKQEKSRKPLVIGIIAAVVILAVLLVLLLTQCTGGGETATTAPSVTETTSPEVPSYTIYWNADRQLYDGKSEAGMSSRMPESDGFFHVRFIVDGEEVVLKVADRKVINALDVKDLMGLEFDDNGIVTAVIPIEDMPLEKTAWQFYVQSAGGKTIKANSSSSMNGMEVLLEGNSNTGIYDMSGKEGPLGTRVTPIPKDRIYAITNLAGELTHVFIYERPNYMLTHEAECEHCGKTVTWYEWIKEDELPITSGHYQLQNDITTKRQSSTEEDAKICLDLNGKRVDGGSGARVYSMHNVGAELAIMDTSEEKTGRLAAHGKGDQGMVVWVRYGAFYLYDGILDGSDATTVKNGTSVALQGNTYMYMFGGEIIGGTSTYTYNEATGKYGNGLGGTMTLANKSKFVMHDGVIRDGYAEGRITAWNKDGTPKTYQRGLGGNIFMSSGSVMEMNGGVIKNGKAFTTTGNIYLDGTAELTINGGTISGGNAMGKGKNGGSIFVSTKATVTQNGGAILYGTTRNCGGNVYVNGTYTMNGGVIGSGRVRDFKTGKINEQAASRNVFVVNGRFSMYGGKIMGGFQITDSSATDNKKATLVLSGFATIDGGEESTTNLTLSNGAGGPVKVIVGTLRDSALIRVAASTGIFTQPTKEANADNFVSDIEGADILYYQECVALGRLNCICGKEEHFGACDGTEYLWAPHTSKTALPNGDGYYYLINDVELSGSTYLQGDVSKHTRVDLNGKSVLGAPGKGRTYSLFENTKTYDEDGKIIPNVEGVEMKLTVTDSVGTGKITMREHNDLDQGSMFWGRHIDSEINIYGGTFDGSAATSTRHNGVVVSAAGDLNIYGGTFIGGTSSSGGIIAVAGANSVFTMTGGTIQGGTATNGGGNIVLSKAGATFNFSGGTIEGGKAMNGGNVYMAAGTVMNMSGGTITGGVVDNSAIEMDGGLGGNIYQNGKFTMTGGTISDGYVRGGTKGGGHGGNIGVYGEVHLLGGTITGGEAKVAGGNIATIATGAVIVMDGVRVENGKAGNNGGNISSYVRACKTLEIKGNTVITGGSAPSGGNISARHGTANGQTMTIAITGGTIENGTATSYGGNIFIFNNTTGEKAGGVVLQVENATISGGKAGTQGGNIFFEQNGSIQLKNAVVEDGVARQGGNIFMLEGEHTFTDSVIRGGHAMKAGDHANGGNLYLTTNAKLDLVGTAVENGQATADTEKKYPTGGNIYFAGNAEVTMDESSVISGGKAVSSVGAWSAGGNIYAAKGTFDINGGTVTGGEAYTQGNNIHIIKGATVTLHSGKLENTYSKNQSVYMEGGVMNIAGGEVVNTADNSRNFSGKADQGSVINMSGGVVTGGKYADGGNFYIPSGETLNISGGEIKDGIATTSGGNIFLTTNAIVNMTGGTVSGGNNTKSGANGGSIYVSGKAVFTMSGGTVKDGSTMNGGGNFYVAGTLNVSGDAHITGGSKGGAASVSGNIMCVNGTVNVSGGVIDGDFGVTNSGRNGTNVTLSGKPVINKGMSSGLHLSFYNSDATGTATPATITVDGKLEAGAKVIISSARDTVLTTNATVQENLEFFEPLDPAKDIIWLEQDKDINGDGESDLHKLIYGMVYCICGVDSDDPADHLGDCGGKLLTWLAWNESGSLPTTAGNWYLTKDVTLTYNQNFEGNGNVNIDLNGKTVSMSGNYRIFRIRNGSETTNTHVAVTDTSAAKTGKVVHTCTGFTEDGGIVWLTQDTHTFSLYGGTLDASGMTAAKTGTAIKANRGVVNIYGGKVIGGALSDSTVNGAAIRVSAPATMNVTGGELTGGTGANQGGIIAVYGVLNISGGKIYGGSAKDGSNIAVIKSAETEPAELNISGGEIAGNVYFNSYAGAPKVTLTGKVVLEKGDDGYGLYCGDRCEMDVSGLTDGSYIDVSASGYFAQGANEAIRGYFHPLVEGEVILDGDKLFLGKENCLCGNIDGKCIDTICDGTKVLWKPWRSTSKLPTATGYWYLTGNVNASTITAVADADVVLDLNGKTVTRSGRLITMRNITNTAYTITDTSAAQTGIIKATGTASDQGVIWVAGTNNKLTLVRGTLDGSGRTLTANAGLMICVGASSTFDMHGGKIIGGTYETAEGKTPYGGAALSNAGTTTIYGGSIEGGTSGNVGGAVFAEKGTFIMKGGSIEGGKAVNGGAVAIKAGTFLMEGGTITGGEATVSGGNIHVEGGTFKMTGGTVSSGKAAAYGGNIHQAGGNVELLGGTVEKGSVTSSTADSGGGNIAANAAAGTLTLNGISVKDGNVSQRGGNLYLYGEGVDMTITGNTLVTGGIANYGANIYLYAANRTEGYAVVTMNGGKITAGAARANAGSVYISDKFEFILNDGVIENGTGKGDGGNVYIRDGGAASGRFTMNGGSLTGGEAGKDNTAGRNGGNVYVAANANFVLNGGTVSGGKSNNSGGNIHVIGTMKMTGGTVKSGSSKNASSHNIAVQGGALEMEGGKVEGNVTVVNSGAAHDSKIILSGEPVIAGGTLGLKLVKVSPATVTPVVTVKGTLGANANIVISKEVSDGVISDSTGGNSLHVFTAQDTNKGIYVIDNATEYPTEVGCLYLGKYGCVCGGEAAGSDCAKAGHPGVKWSAWTSTTSTPGTDGVSGNFYLTADIKLTTNQNYAKAGVYNIDLNGYNISTTSDRLFRLRNNADPTVDYAVTIGITNTRKVSGKGIISSTNTAAQEGYLVWMVQPSQVFNLYAGTLDGSKATTVASKNGGTVMLNEGTFNMYGGEIKGGTATGNGGNVSLNATTTFNLVGGTVSGGNAKNGGNFNVTGTLNISGGTVTGGNATSGGGNIMVNSGGKVVLSGNGKIEKGAATATGGNMHIAANGNFTMLGGSVTEGNAAGATVKDHENVYCKFGNVDLRGGLIDGFIMIHNYDTSASSIKISGNIQITGGSKNLVLAWGKGSGSTAPTNYPVIQLGELTKGAKIGVTSGATLIAEASGNAILANGKQYFFSDSTSKQIVQTADGLAFTNAGTVMQCICGGELVNDPTHTCVDVAWTEVDAAGFLALFGTEKKLTASHTVILTEDVALDAEYALNGNTLDLNLGGKTITMSANGRLTANGTTGVLNLTDCGGGKIVAAEGCRSSFLYTYKGKINIYCGTVDASKCAAGDGGAIRVGYAGDFLNIYGGKIIGSQKATNGGSIYCKVVATTTIYGGEITGGKARNGGNIALDAGAVLYLKGGKVTNGETTGTAAGEGGGNIRTFGDATLFYMEGGEVSGGMAKGTTGNDGGNININRGKAFLSGGVVTGGSATGNGGGVYVGYNTLGVTISGNVQIFGNQVTDVCRGTNTSATKGILVLGNWTGNTAANGPAVLGSLMITDGGVVVHGATDVTLTDADLAKFSFASSTQKLTLSGGNFVLTAK